MAPTIAEILSPVHDDPALVERIAFRLVKAPIAIVEYNPEWAQRFQEVRQRIEEALRNDLYEDIAHTGSSSVEGLPAKDIIDVDLVMKDITDEGAYVKPLEAAGFRFLLREPHWYQHRFFVSSWPNAYNVNLHVWGLDSPEAARHRIFRDWLRKTPADLQLYAKVKRDAADQTNAAGETLEEYNNRKQQTIRDILNRAFRDLGYIE